LADAVRLVRIRGRAMQEAVPVGMGAMAALIGVEFSDAAAIAAEAAQGEVVQAANDNGGGQVVVSGHRSAVERAVEIAKARGDRHVCRNACGGGCVQGRAKLAIALIAQSFQGASSCSI